MPKVSVIIPTFNRADFLLKTINSVQQQTFADWEMIIVSNGSTDNTASLVNNLADLRIKFFEQDNTGGPAGPRNTGIAKANGKYLAFCDDDDLWEPTKLNKQVEVLDNNSNFGVCYTSMQRFDENKTWMVSHENGKADFNSLLYINTVPISSVMVRADILRDIGGFNESKSIGNAEDYELLLRLAKVTNFYYISEPLIKYWSGVGRFTKLDNNRKITDDLNYFKSILAVFAVLHKKTGVHLSELFLPTIFHIKNCCKSIIVNLRNEIFST